MTPTQQVSYIKTNKLIKVGGSFRLMLDHKTKVDKLEMRQNVAQSLYRTFAHNSELVEMQTVRNIIMEKATVELDKEGVDELNTTLAENRGKELDGKTIVPMFLKLDYDYGSFNELPKWVHKYYKTPNHLSNYNGLSRSITLVKRGQSDVLLGHRNLNIFNPDGQRTLSKIERVFKEGVVMAKQHMVVSNASKLGVDIVSNFALLLTKDVSLRELKNNIPEAFRLYKDFSHKRGAIVELELKARMGSTEAQIELKKAKEDLKKHAFYAAFKAGFVQSFSTNLVIKEFDTVSGLQKRLDDVVEHITRNKKGEANEIFKAIKWWQKLGGDKVSIDHLIQWASEISVIKGTDIGTEMKELSARLRAKKDVDSVARYVGDIVGGPASEAVIIGGAVMVMADVVSKYALAKSLKTRTNPATKRMYTEEEAYTEANNTFIDYRRNMPSQIKILSDYGILLFPAFWLKAQKVIVNLLKVHPVSSASIYGVAEYFDMSSTNFLDVNIVQRVIDGHVVNNPAGLIDWQVLSPWYQLKDLGDL